MKRFIPVFWFASTVAALSVLLATVAAVGQSAPPPRGERLVMGFMSCTGANGERQCPFGLHYLPMVHGRAYAFQIESTEFDATMMLEDDAGNLLARDNDDVNALPGWMIFRPERTGNYRLVVSALAPMREGYYAVTIRELPVILMVEETMAPVDPMRNECHERAYEVPMIAGRTYVIDMASRDFLPYLSLRDEDDMIVAFQDESDSRRPARIVYTPTRTGTFRLVASTLEPMTFGNFLLSVCEKER